MTNIERFQANEFAVERYVIGNHGLFNIDEEAVFSQADRGQVESSGRTLARPVAIS